jgi:prepilin-type N-terminal cleavage/methylation domain-containing protein
VDVFCRRCETPRFTSALRTDRLGPANFGSVPRPGSATSKACLPGRSLKEDALRSTLQPRLDGFTLIELLIVIALISILLVLVGPAFTNIRRGNDITRAAYTISGLLEQARSYAKANHTYTWVGFYEENTSAASPTNSTPPYPGKGRVVMAAVFSNDGTKILNDGDPNALLPPSRISQLGKLIKIEGVHLTDIGEPAGGNPDSIDGRPGTPYTEGAPWDHFNRINSDSGDATQFAFTAQQYTFYKTIRFNPREEANMNSTYTLKHAAEIGIKPTRGNAVDPNDTNIAAIQFGGIGGNIKIYRK